MYTDSHKEHTEMKEGSEVILMGKKENFHFESSSKEHFFFKVPIKYLCSFFFVKQTHVYLHFDNHFF